MALPKIWSDALAEFIANQIPIHLIDLHTLRLASRSDVAQHYRPILAAHIQKHPSTQHASRQQAARTVFHFVKYAIFSHRWLPQGEPTFQDVPTLTAFAHVFSQDDQARSPGPTDHTPHQTSLTQALATHIPDHSSRAGLHKLLLFCSKARSYRCPFAWSDTCCIDKGSSAELDESIRSMFRWYRNARICIVHLASSLALDDIPADEWFTRGWTLQELLAPENIKFYDREWRPFTQAKNDKDRQNNGCAPEGEINPVWNAILTTTRIPPGRLSYFSPGAFDVAQRFSWAAGRRTTRIEDMAYALLGIFNLNMPVQYGEGKFAFQRLMETLLQRVQDYGIFVWTGPSSQYSSALPASVNGYLAAREADNSVSVPNCFGDPSVMMTHKGLQVEILLVPMQCREADDGNSDGETSSSESAEERSSQGTDKYDDDDDQSSEHNHGDTTSASEPPDARSHSDTENDELPSRFLLDDVEYQSSGSGRPSWFHFSDPEGVFKPLSIRGRGPIVIIDDFSFSDTSFRQYALAILDYHRDWKRGPGHVYVPYEEKPRYLAFILYREDSEEAWSKMETDVLVYVEVEADREWRGKTENVCL